MELSIIPSVACSLICTFSFRVFLCRKERLDRIRQKRWAKGNVLTEQEQSLMSKEEVNYFQQYDSLLSSYMQHTGFDLSAVVFICALLI